MTAKWEDTTSYAQGQRGKKDPDCWTVKSGLIKISVVKDHVMNPGYWSMHCPMLGMDTVSLKMVSSVAAHLAQGAAVNMVKTQLRELASSLSKIS